MSQTITVEVTQDDIDNGKRCSDHDCAIARAVARTLNMHNEVMMGSTIAYLGDLTPTAPVQLPQEATDFIRAFDGEQPVKPFSFEIDLPDPS